MRLRVGSLTALVALVAAGKGVTLAAAEVDQSPHPRAVFVALKPPVPSVASAAVYRKGETSADLSELLALCVASPR